MLVYFKITSNSTKPAPCYFQLRFLSNISRKQREIVIKRLNMLENQSCLISRSLPSSCEEESHWIYMTYSLLERCSKPKRSPLVEDDLENDFSKEKKRKLTTLNQSDSNSSNENEGNSNSNSLINPIGRDNSINCLIRCSRSDYGSIALLNTSFHNLIRTGELYRLRRMMGIAEHWVYFSCNVLEWEAYDPYRSRWMTLPRLPHNECFMCSDKESLAVGTDLLVFGKEVNSHVVLRYSILDNSWSNGVIMNSPRCLFGSASLGEKAVIAGGTDSRGKVLDTAELYNSETQTWTTLPSMNKARKLCSGVFMDGKFYVIGGTVKPNELLTCGEEYDFEKGTWRVIPNMSLGLSGATGAPPLVGVVDNELYAADYSQKELRKYRKEDNTWVTLGNLPERPTSMNGWGLAFRACGERLIVIGGPRVMGGGMIELHSWVPREGPPEWSMIASKHSGSFVYNCAVMGC